MSYLPRIADSELDLRLGATGAVLIEGPRASGKTAMATQRAASHVYFDRERGVRQMVEVDPAMVLRGPPPRLIDEWQIVPEVWNHVRRAVDERAEPGQFILTGSAVPPDDVTRHTGAGRITRLRLRPMSLFESGQSSGEASLADLLAGRSAPTCASPLSAPDLAELICRGGWPALQGRSAEHAMIANQGYVDELRRTDIRRVDGVGRRPALVERVLRSLARNVATCASIATVARDARGPDNGIAERTVVDYLEALKRLMVREDQPPWAPHLRSRSRLRAKPKRHFVDPSLAAASLRAGPGAIRRDPEWFGLLFESLAVRDLRVYAQSAGGRVLHYRDGAGLEVDAVIESGIGPWGAFEIKLSSARADEAAKSLLKFADRVDTARMGEPAVLGVIVGDGYGYARPDGVMVVPLATLGP
ncbi:ATP-binding protein [Candidatus Palauibacter sp.]|uniref:ATP-binding protein n=1 Tax=Candidatus Palauibacter sp. TaxID=3101350 RepID=UPI003B02257F